jgi:hypothetical protein
VSENTCKNPYVDSDGFCSMCGKNHYRVTPNGEVKPINPKRTDYQREYLIAEKRKAIDLGIESNPLYKAFRDTVRDLNNIYGLSVKVVFSNKENGHYNGETNTISIGYQAIDIRAKLGCQEYKTVEYLLPWPWRARKGEKAAKLIAAHEFAHALAAANGKSDCHGPNFQRYYREVLELVFTDKEREYTYNPADYKPGKAELEIINARKAELDAERELFADLFPLLERLVKA